jgi:hypothetical protein
MIDLRAMNWKVLLLVILLFVGALFVGRFLGQQQEKAGEYELLAPLWCEPQAGPCSYNYPPGGKIRFSLEPQERIQPMEPLTATVEYSDGQMSASSLLLTGLNMGMGQNRFAFHQEGDAYTARILIPVCTLERMEWRALVRMTIQGRRLAVPFHFAVDRN